MHQRRQKKILPMATIFHFFSPVHNCCTKGNNDIATKGEWFTLHCYSLFIYYSHCKRLRPSVRHAVSSWTTRRNSTKLVTSLTLMVRVCESNIIFPCASPSMRPSPINLSVTLSSPKPLGGIQTCYISSPHDKAMREQHYFSVRPSICLSLHLLLNHWAELFVCVEVLRPSQPNGVMSSAVSLPNHTFTGQA